MFDKNFSINQTQDISAEIDETVFNLYDTTLKKNGEIVTINSITSFIDILEKKKSESLLHIAKTEKWFRKGIHLIQEYRPYKEKQDRDEDIVKELNKTYPKFDFESIQNEYTKWGWTTLVNLLYYIDQNIEYLNDVTFASVAKNALELKESILTFDRLYLQKERFQDLLQLIFDNGLSNELKKESFTNYLKIVSGEEKSKQGRKFDESAPQQPIVNYITELISKAKSGDPKFKKYWHFNGAYKDTPNKKQLIKALLLSDLKGELSHETVKDRVKKALSELGY